MSVTDREFDVLAKLAKLEISGERRAEFLKDFEELIACADSINAAVVGDTASISDVGGETIAFENLRPDEVSKSLPQEKITANTQSENGYFPVKRVVK